MKRWVRSLTSLLMSLSLTLGLCVTALADEDEPAQTEAAETENTPVQKPASESVPASSDAKPAESKPAESKPAESKPAESKPVESKPAESKPAESKPAESKPAETKPAETKPAESKPAESKPAETKPAESKPAESKPVESKPAEHKPAESKPAESKPTESKPVESNPTEQKPVESKPAESKPAESKPAEARPAEAAPVEQSGPPVSAPVETAKPAETEPAAETAKPEPASYKSVEADPVRPSEPVSAAEDPSPAEAVHAEEAAPVAAAGPEEAPSGDPAPLGEAASVEDAASSEEPVPASSGPTSPSPAEEANSSGQAPVRSAVPAASQERSGAGETGEEPAAADVEDALPTEEQAFEVVSADPAELSSEEEPEDASAENRSTEGIETVSLTSAPVFVSSKPAAAAALMDSSSDGAGFVDPTGASSADASSSDASSSDASSSDSSSQSRTSCSYTIEDGSHVIVNHTGGSYKAESGKELTILAAGLNHIDSISGSGKVKIGGSGILLVDNLSADTLKNLELLSFTDMYGDKGGSVAVFRKIDNNTYELVNGSVPGILDEEYQIDGIMLIVPAGSKLILGSIGASGSGNSVTYYTGDDSGAHNADNTESAGHLIIGKDADLILNGDLEMVTTDSRVLDKINTAEVSGNDGTGVIAPTLGIEGTGQVYVSGSLTGGQIDVSGTLSSSGTLKDILIRDSGSGDSVTNTGSSSQVDILKQVATGTLTKEVGGATVLDSANLAANLPSVDSKKKLILELRRKYKDGTIISSRFEPVFVTVDITVTDGDAEGELTAWEIDKDDILDPANSSPYTGNSIVNTNISFTGSGILGGNYPLHIDPETPSTVTVGGETYVLREEESSPAVPERRTAPERRVAPAVTPRTEWRVIVSPKGDYYIVRIYYGTREVVDPGQKMTARMKFSFPAGWNKNAVFAVFRNSDNSLTAFKATYDAASGTLRFDTDRTGTFTLVSFPFDGKLYSEDFYDALADLDEIRDLPVRR